MNYKWACIGCGHIANEMAQAMQGIGGSFFGVYSRTKEKAKTFAEKYDIKKVYSSIDELLADDIDIVYIAIPHNSHIEYLKKALGAKKHVLCEKAITLNSDELDIAVKIAEENNVILAEAMTIFHCPVYKRLDEIIASGKLGALKTVMVNLGSYKDYDMTNRFFNMNLAGGAMLDIGVYALSFARYFMTKCPDCDTQVLSQMKKAPSGVDEQVNILLTNDNDEMSTINLALTSKMPKLGYAGYDKGYITVDNYNRTNRATITYTEDEHIEVIEDDTTMIGALAYEVEDMENAVAGEENRMHLDYTLDVMKIMTYVRQKHNMLYPEEQ